MMGMVAWFVPDRAAEGSTLPGCPLMAREAREVPGDAGAPEERTGTDAGTLRRCQVCGLRLSRYNPGPNCWQHTIGFPWRGPTAKPKYD